MEPIRIYAAFQQEQQSLGVIGRTGEHEARQIEIDCADVLKTWPDAEILCVCRRPCDMTPYPLSLTPNDEKRMLLLTRRETAASGMLKRARCKTTSCSSLPCSMDRSCQA